MSDKTLHGVIKDMPQDTQDIFQKIIKESIQEWLANSTTAQVQQSMKFNNQ